MEALPFTQKNAFKDFCLALGRREDIWVRFINNRHKRYGSIGMISGVRNTTLEDKTHKNYRTGTNATINTYIYVEFPGTKHAPIKLYMDYYNLIEHIEILPNYTGPAVRKNETPVLPKAEVFDMNGVKIEEGDFVAAAISGKLQFGTVKRIKDRDKSLVFVRIGAKTARIIRDTSNMAVIDEYFKQRMLIKKLASGF